MKAETQLFCYGCFKQKSRRPRDITFRWKRYFWRPLLNIITPLLESMEDLNAPAQIGSVVWPRVELIFGAAQMMKIKFPPFISIQHFHRADVRGISPARPRDVGRRHFSSVNLFARDCTLNINAYAVRFSIRLRRRRVLNCSYGWSSARRRHRDAR